MSQSRQLLKEQARAYICGKLGHCLRFVLPVKKRDESREVYAACVICEEYGWVQLPEDGYQKFLVDLTNGKIK